MMSQCNSGHPSLYITERYIFMIRNFENETLDAKRKYLYELMEKITEKQMNLFIRLFGEKVSDEKLDSAISICERTIY